MRFSLVIGLVVSLAIGYLAWGEDDPGLLILFVPMMLVVTYLGALFMWEGLFKIYAEQNAKASTAEDARGPSK